MEFNQDAKSAIERMVQAYGVKTKLALCEALGITASALANRQNRNAFPAEYVLKCALDTGASVRWLTYGHGDMFEQTVVSAPNAIAVPSKKLQGRQLHAGETLLLDKAFLPEGIKNPLVVIDGSTQYIATQVYNEIYDGTWLIDIDGNISIREIVRTPGNRVNVSDHKSSFSCLIDELKVIAKILIICSPL
ncbi:phage repressor protein CI [Serratia fonticola]|uniref:phage repressor protein CI n=1 Tax=Serratia fonticola TaxID=47917 RepID=UPI0027FDB991|nr:phage repressor protein CI [Serratia fonticola]MDQ7210903.1 phage repressor protein CI [Serratia fonticola]HBE9080955.1 phage repressor protein CI [Serratia fonticola]HBE9091481.1 phage repressor protein CI [Serratia fonticola]HBE9153975.1 phage repressor protein CI [Serratia fonticola]